jgi:hypothetical protein
MAENFGASYSENDLRSDESAGFAVPERKPISKMEMLARRVAKMLLTLVMTNTSIDAAASTNSSYTSPANAYEYRAVDPTFESIRGNAERLKAAQSLVGTLSYRELNGEPLDDVSAPLYFQMVDRPPAKGYALTPEDYALLINIELATHGALIDVTNGFTQYVSQYYVNNPNSYDAYTKDWGIDALKQFQGYLNQHSIVTQANGARIDVFGGALGWVFERLSNTNINQADISLINQRLREVMNLIMAMQANIEKMACASEFGKELSRLGSEYRLLDRRAGVDELRAALTHINKKSNTYTIRTLLANFSNKNLVWVAPVGPGDTGHYDFVNDQGGLVLQGRVDVGSGYTHYYDIGSSATTPLVSVMSLRTVAQGGTFGEDVGWFKRLISSFDIDISVNAGIGIGAEYGGGRMLAGWQSGGTQWNPYNGWGQSDPGWHEKNNGEVWYNVWHSTVHDRVLNRVENTQYKAGFKSVSGTANAQRVYSQPNPGPNSGKIPTTVTGNTPHAGGKGFSNSPNVKRQQNPQWVRGR